jgi:hypothetical protein
MSRSFSLRGHRLPLAVMAMLLLGLSCAAASASAASTEVNCAGLQSALSAAKAGDVITLNELCKTGFPYKLPALALTLTGTPGAGFDGGSTVQLEGSGAAPTIEGLIFENAHSTAANSGGALSLNAAPSDSTVTLAHDTFISDVATGGEGGGARINTASAAVTVSDSTFSSNSTTGAGGALTVFATSANLSGDTFTGNSATGAGSSGGALSAFSLGGPFVLSSSSFTGNSANAEGGGAQLTAEAAGIAITLNGNTFSHNAVSDPGGTNTNSRGYLGGGLSLQGITTASTNAVQQGNTFDGNGVSFKPAAVSAMGGGEATTHVALQSTGDRFTNNTLQSPNAKENAKPERVFGWGAGLSVAECAETTEPPPSVPNVVSTLTNAIVSGNTLQSGPSANGAGMYIGFVCPNAYSTLEVRDSTVTANTVTGASGPVAGISGGPHDVLSLANTIVFGDSGGPELGGFNGLVGVSAASSDVCTGASPFSGAGNICAAPQLVSPSTGDVHETQASPTVDAGSNTLVPLGLSTDVFGGERTLAGHAVCSGEVPKVVDMGAAEYAPAALPCAPKINGPAGPVPGLTQFVSIKVSSKGVALTLSCKGASTQVCSGGAEITTAETLKGKSKKIVAVSAHSKVPDKIAVKIAQASFSIAGGASATVQLKLDKTGLALLKRFHAMPALVLASEATTSGPFLFVFHGVRFTQAKKPKKKHKSRHPKHH